MRKLPEELKMFIFGPILGILSFLVYALTLSSGAYPGESASLIVRHLGLAPLIQPMHLLWGSVARIIALIPLGGVAPKLNVFSAMCGSMTVWLLYSIISKVIYSLIDTDAIDKRHARIAATIAGVTAAGFLAFSIPFWIVSNRAHTASFDLLLLLFCVWLLQEYAATGKAGVAVLLAFLYGTGCVEFATFIVFAPMAGLALLFLMMRHGHLRGWHAVTIGGAAIAGLLLYVYFAFSFSGTTGSHLNDCGNVFDVLWLSWKGQYLLIAKSLPREGWLLVLIMTTIPWLTCLVVARQALSGARDWGSHILHVVMTAMSVMVILNFKLSPWQLTVSYGRLLVTPYLLGACVFGYLAAYWYLLPLLLSGGKEESRTKVSPLMASTLIAVGFGILVCIAPFLNRGKASTDLSAPANLYARETVKSLAGRKWLVTDGNIDNLLLIQARDLRIPLRILNCNDDGNELYLRYVGSLFEEPRLKNSASVGVLSLLQEWFKSTPRVAADFAFLTMPDMLRISGMTVIPNKLVFIGAGKEDKVDPDRLMAEHILFWKEFAPSLSELALRTGAGDTVLITREMLRQMSFAANNLGVLLEDLGASEKALEAYGRAYEMDRGNVSAVLNISSMLDRGFKTAKASAVRREIEGILSDPAKKRHIWELSRYYGYVRSPEAFAGLGWTWARSGQVGLALADLKRAAELLPSEKKGDIAETMAGIYLSQDNTSGEAIYRKILNAEPGNQKALLGMSRISIERGSFETAKVYLQKAAANGADKNRIAMEMAVLNISAGNIAEARLILQELVAVAPDALNAWVMLAGVLVRQDDVPALEQCLKKIEKLNGGQAFISIISAQRAMRKKEYRSARTNLERALVALPNNAVVLQQLLKVDLLDDKPDSALLHSRMLLRMNPNNALANYAMGYIQSRNNEKALAEDSFRRSIESERSPKALNDLSWLLQGRGEYIEAEKLVREALSINSRMPRIWDTLGVVLTKSGAKGDKKLDEAEQAFRKALSLVDNDPSVLLHLAILQLKQGNTSDYSKTMGMVMNKADDLAAEDKKDLEELRRKSAVR